MGYLPIEDYGVVGNMRTVALVGKNGNVDWFCFPNFDSPSLFAALLDDKRGGSFRLYPVSGEITRKQLYWPDTNVLITRYLANEGVGEITDYMPVDCPRKGDGYHGLIRRLKVVRGEMRFRVECQPAFNYARDAHTVELVKGGARFLSRDLRMALASNIPLSMGEGGVWAEFTLKEGESASFELHGLHEDGAGDRLVGRGSRESCSTTRWSSGGSG